MIRSLGIWRGNPRPFYDRVAHILTVYEGSEKCIFEGTVVGYKKIALLDQIQTKELVKELVIEIIDSRVAPTLSPIGIFE